MGRPGSGALPPPTARPLGGLPGPTTQWLWARGGAGVGTRHQPHSARSCVLWGRLLPRCGASGVGRSPYSGCPPSARAAGAHYPLAVAAGGCGRGDPSPTHSARSCEVALRAVRAARGRPGGAPPAWVWGVRGRALSRPRQPALWAGCRGPLPTGCGCGGVRMWGPVTNPQHALLRAGFARCGGGTREPGGAPPASVWGVRGRALSHPRLPALWAGWRGPLPTGCGCGGVRAWGRVNNPTARALACCGGGMWAPGGGASCLGVGCPGSGALLPPAARPLGGLPVCACACPAWPGRAGRPPGRVLLRLTFPLAVLGSLFACSAPSGLGLPCLWLLLGFSVSFPLLPLVAPPLCPALRVFRPRVPWALASTPPFPPFCFFLLPPSVRPFVSLCVFYGLVCPSPWRHVAQPPPLFFVRCRVVLCCGALLSFFCFSPCWWRWFPVVPRWFWAPGRFWVVSVSVLCLCGAVLVCLRRCSLFGALWPSRGWLVFCVVACYVCVFAVGPGCPPLSPGGSWWLLVSCLGGVLWCVPGCCAAPCCCALCRLALRCCALCCFVLLRLVLPRAVLCPGALSVVLGSCAFWRRVLSCPPALCVFCCGVSPRGVVRRCALCRVRPGVSCCAFPVVSALCGVAVWPALPRCPAPLCCASWCCAAAWCRGVLSCRLVGFVSGVGLVVPTCKTAAKFRKIFFPFFWLLKKKKLYTTQHTRVQHDHVRCCALRVTRRF